MATTYLEEVPTPSPARTTTRPTATYAEYVRDYSRLSAWYGFLCFAGVALIVGAGMFLTGKVMIVFVAAGLGIAGGGAVGLLAVGAAHAAFSRHLGMVSTTTYQPTATTPSVRPFVPSTNGSATIRAGRFTLTQGQWVKLFQTAIDGGRLTRDAAVKALPRQYYRDWQSTLAELARLGIVDANGVITTDGWTWYQDNVSPYSHEGPTTTGAPSTHAPHARGAA